MLISWSNRGLSVNVSSIFSARYSLITLLTLVLAGCGGSGSLKQANNSLKKAALSMNTSELRVEYRVNPLGIDIVKPRHSWIVNSSSRSDIQTAYQILAASSPELLARDKGDLWDTGKVKSSATNQIAYAGKNLQSRMRVYWKVRVWDRYGRVSPWSETAFWSMGLLNFSDWEADWIGFDTGYQKTDPFKEVYMAPSPYIRTEFKTKNKKIKHAMLYTSAMGLFEMRLNGKRVGEDYFTPGWTDYDDRIYYFTYDVTENIRDGANALGAILSDGWFSGYVGYSMLFPNDMERTKGFWGDRPGLLTQLEIEYEDGERQTVSTVSDRHRKIHTHKKDVWKASTGPVRESDILMGETYDARKEINGWDEPGYNDSKWKNVRYRMNPLGAVEAYPGVPVRKQYELTPKKRTSPKKGVYIFDLGKNFAGIVRLKVKGKAGTKIKLRFGEMLHQDGTLMTENLRSARVTNYYILKGKGEEIWEPQFTYHGFQFVEVSGYPGEPSMDAVTGIVMNSETPQVGELKFYGDKDWGGERPLVTQLFENIKTTQFANFFDVPTDCPQRDERLGWTGDAQVYIRTSAYIADVSAFFTKWIRDLRDAQRWYGAYATVAPMPYSRVYEYSPGWTDAGVIIPYMVYQAYGDTRMLEEHWQSMTKFMEFQADAAGDDYLRPGAGRNYGDWLAVGHQTDKDFLASAYYGYDAQLMSEMAAAIGKSAEAKKYAKLFSNIKNAFVKKYIAEDGTMLEDSQTAYAMALAMNLYPEKLAAAGAKKLAEKVRANGDRLATGFLGVRHLLPVLSQYGYEDLSYDLLLQTEYPSWGYEVVNGATSIWERWNSYTVENGFMNPAMNSFSHYAYGSVGEWMFSDAAGIDAITPGYEKIEIKPLIQSSPFRGITAQHKSIRGMIKAEWRKEARDVLLNVTVPANVEAMIYVPGEKEAFISEGAIRASMAEGVEYLRAENGYVIYKVGGGDYRFRSTAALPN